MRKVLLLMFMAAIGLTSKAQLTVSGGDSSMCAGDTITYTASGMMILGWVDTLNQDTSLNATYEFTTNVVGTHTLYAVGINLVPADTDTIGIDITVNMNPMASIMSSAGMSLCEGSSTELIGMPAGMSSYMWSPASSLDTTGGDTVLATPSSDTTYTLMVMDSNGCMGSAMYMVSVIPSPSVSITSTSDDDNGFVCTGGSATMTAVASGGIASYEWSPTSTLNDTTSMMVVASPTGNTTYTVVVTDSNGCTDAATKLIRVNANPPTMVFQPTEATICEGEGVFIDVLSTGDVYSWSPTTGVDSPTSQDVTLSPTSTTTYTLTAEQNACVTTGQITITVQPAPALSVALTTGAGSICLDETAVITATCTDCVSYTWAFPNSSLNTTNNVQTVSPNTSGIVTINVTGFDDEGCYSEGSVNLTVDSCFVGTPFGIVSAEGAELNVLNQVDQVTFQSNEVISEVNLFNLLGEAVSSVQGNNTSAVIAKAELASGVYIARVTMEDGEQIVRKLYLQ